MGIKKTMKKISLEHGYYMKDEKIYNSNGVFLCNIKDIAAMTTLKDTDEEYKLLLPSFIVAVEQKRLVN